MSWLTFLTVFLLCGFAHSKRVAKNECHLPGALVTEIHGYKDLVAKIISEATNGSYSGRFYDDLTSFTDKYGARKTGTDVLDITIKYLSNTLSEKNLITKLENVTVPKWLRGKETAFYITSFRKKRLRIKALGGSASGQITGPLMIIKDVDELRARSEEASGKVILFNTEFLEYEVTVRSRFDGPAAASHLGAVGVLVRSVTPFSIGSIHVGQTDFKDQKPIPAASISLEDADILSRMIKKENITIQMTITNKEDSGKNILQNLIADIPGKSQPQNYMIMSGHIDSWDVGQGALDDGGGAFLALHSLLLLKHLKVEPPKRTLRAILWTGEEMGLYGSKAYAAAHGNELRNWTAAFESDEGLFEPLGFKTNGNKNATCILKEIASMFTDIKATEVESTNGSISSDISIFTDHGVPLMEPLMKPNNYFWFHHTEGDSMRVMNSTLMDRHLALITGTSYILANLSIALPRGEIRRSGSALGRRKLRKSNH